MSVKEEVLKIIKDLSSNVTLEDIIHVLTVKGELEKGLKQL